MRRQSKRRRLRVHTGDPVDQRLATRLGLEHLAVDPETSIRLPTDRSSSPLSRVPSLTQGLRISVCSSSTAAQWLNLSSSGLLEDLNQVVHRGRQVVVGNLIPPSSPSAPARRRRRPAVLRRHLALEVDDHDMASSDMCSPTQTTSPDSTSSPVSSRTSLATASRAAPPGSPCRRVPPKGPCSARGPAGSEAAVVVLEDHGPHPDDR